MKIDYQILTNNIQSLAKEDLKILSTSSLKLYATDVREAFVKYISVQVKSTYKEVVDTIPKDKEMDFLNLKSGYVISMTNWINSNPMNMPCIELDEEEPEQSNEDGLREFVKKKEVQTIGAGTALSFIFLVSGLKFWAFVAESLAIALGIYEYKSQRGQTQKVNLQKEQELQVKVNAYIANVENIAMEWANAAEQQSNKLLSSYLG